MIRSAERGIRHGKIRINLNGTLKQGHRCGVVSLRLQRLSPHAVSLECFKRGRGGLVDRRIEFPNGLEGLTDFFAQLCRSSAERLQNAFFAVCGHLLLCEVIAGLAVDSVDTDDVLTAKTRDRTAQIRLASHTLAEIAGDRGC